MNREHLFATVATLNEGQRAAVERIAGGWRGENGAVRLTIVDGPPGTGKTHVGAVSAGRWISDAPRRRVVVLTPTHTAAERMQEKLLEVGFRNEQVLRLRSGRSAYDARRGVLDFSRFESLPNNLRRVHQRADVLVTTWQGSQRAIGTPWASWGPSGFLLIVDEVSQISFAAFLSIMRRVYPRRPAAYALLGDPQQLPVIASQEILGTNAALGILRRHPECDPCRLLAQYRMNDVICAAVNEVRRVAFGGEPLTVGSEDVGSRRLGGGALPGSIRESRFADILDPEVPVVLVDTSRFASERQWRERAVGTSWEYEEEARLASEVARVAREGYGDRHTIVVSSPYAAQVELLGRLDAENAITIYRAQGNEWDLVVLSLSRTMGPTILDDVYQNVYVGLSRARCKLVILLNVDLFQQSRVFNAVLRLAQTGEGVRLLQADPDWVTK